MAMDEESISQRIDAKSQGLVLLIDDDPMVAEALRVMLENEDDLRMHYCSDASSALDVAEQLKPTVILLDMVMPDINGLMLLRYLRVNESTSAVPVVALSMKDDAKLKAEVFTAGGNDYLIKLPEAIELIARIRYHSNCYIRLLQRDEAFRALDISQRKLAASNIKLQQLASMDGLTGIPNRRYFQETMQNEWERATDDGKPLSVVLMDIDFFKKCNDHYGHQYGDEVLCKVAKAMESSMEHKSELVARFGGEEFVALLPGVDIDGAAAVGERLRKVVDSLKLDNVQSEVCAWVTISIGVSSCMPGTEGTFFEQLIKSADEALYEAKMQGRNRVVKSSDLNHSEGKSQ